MVVDQQNSKNTHLWFSVGVIVLLYIINAMYVYELFDFPPLVRVVEQHIRSNDEFSFMEVFSAVLWLFAFLLFCGVLYRSIRINKWNKKTVWYILFVLISLAAFGEEVSWGDHFFNYPSGTILESVNAQHETNLHNINIAQIFNLSEDFKFRYYLENLGRLLNPVFYLFLTALWCILPYLKRKNKLPDFEWFNAMPVPSKGMITFFFFHLLFFCFVDMFLFNVSYIFELFIALAACNVALDFHISLGSTTDRRGDS